MLSLSFAFLPWRVHLHATVRALPACARPALGAGGSSCPGLSCVHCTPLPPHKPPRGQSLSTPQYRVRRCQGCDGWWLYNCKASPCHASPVLSILLLSTNYTKEILCRYFKTIKTDRKCIFCILKYVVMFQSHILSWHFMAKLPSHK